MRDYQKFRIAMEAIWLFILIVISTQSRHRSICNRSRIRVQYRQGSRFPTQGIYDWILHSNRSELDSRCKLDHPRVAYSSVPSAKRVARSSNICDERHACTVSLADKVMVVEEIETVCAEPNVHVFNPRVLSERYVGILVRRPVHIRNCVAKPGISKRGEVGLEGCRIKQLPARK